MGDSEGMILVNPEEYKRLEEDSELLEALRFTGVDSWEGMNLAIETLIKWRTEDATKE